MKRNILIVEDDLALCNGIALALKSDDLIFEMVHTLAGAKKICSRISFDLVILDISLPDGSGLDLLVYIKLFSNSSVILLTANDMEKDIVSGLEMGAEDYITKPFSPMVLQAKINTQFRKTTAGSAV